MNRLEMENDVGRDFEDVSRKREPVKSEALEVGGELDARFLIIDGENLEVRSTLEMTRKMATDPPRSPGDQHPFHGCQGRAECEGTSLSLFQPERTHARRPIFHRRRCWLMPKAGVIGTGLVGGSIAGGLTDAGWRTIGYDPDPEAIGVARDRGLVSAAASSVAGVIAEAPDVVVVAAPPKATIEILAHMDTPLVVMDVSGVKGKILAAAKHLPNFVGTHPMAGRETSGPKAASVALFRGAMWVVVEDGPPGATAWAVKVVETLGANAVFMSAEAHDQAVAAISHLPQLLAAGLLASAADTPEAIDLAAGSFRDLTRVAASLPLPWVEILKTNSAAVLGALEALRAQLSAVEMAITSDDDDLLTYLSKSRDMRQSLGSPEVAVRVMLADEPGEIARVGHALEECRVDVRDIQMRHAPHGGGGILTLAVRAGEEQTLRHALTAAGLLTVS